MSAPVRRNAYCPLSADPVEPAVIVVTPDTETELSALAVAVIVTVLPAGTLAGAVYVKLAPPSV